ncbi:MAG: hypothetical protein FWD79_04745 [Desulfobulbus sp.]|nr:hypothetical protein [Desulfobulbus sp.]
MQKCKGMQWVLFLGMMLAFMLAGCAQNKTVGNDNAGLPQLSNFADDIKDITVPAELEWDRKGSMVIKTESFRGGIFTYKGRVELTSLKDYMVASMQDNKWRLVGETASKDIMLAFVKPNKTCMMVMSDGILGKAELKLYVAIDKTGGSANATSDTFPQ